MNVGWQRLFYRHGWDTRSRNVLPARLLRPLLTPSQPAPLLDVGCGYLGLAEFLSGVPVIGVDLEAPTATNANVRLLLGSVMALPFSDGAFSLVSCIDVLEHLSVADRQRAVGEIMRVASKAVLIACPHGQPAQACDDEFRRAAARRNRPVPDWVHEHLRQPYPEEAAIIEHLQNEAASSGRKARISSLYCEPIKVSRLVRMAATRSDLLYMLVNLLFGFILPLLPNPNARDSYRMVLLVDLTGQETSR